MLVGVCVDVDVDVDVDVLVCNILSVENIGINVQQKIFTIQ